MTAVHFDPMCRIDIYSHFFTITKYTPRIAGIVYKFSWKYTQSDFSRGNGRGGPVEKVPGRTYGVYNKFLMEFRFHIGQLKEMMELFSREMIEPHLYEWHVHELYEPATMAVLPNEAYNPYDYQLRAIDFILAPDEEGDLRTRFIAMPTGTGKSLTAVRSTTDERCRTRTLICMQAKYLKKWPRDVTEYTTVSGKRVVVLKGSKEIRAVISIARDGDVPYDYILVSMTTMLNYIKDFEDNPELCLEMYGLHPQKFCELLGIGQVIVDEAHENLHGVYRLMVYTHVPKFIGLSGSLLHLDPFIERMQHMMFPKEMRFNEIKMKKYIQAYAIAYSFNDFEGSKIRTQEYGSSTYSQTAFEQSILKKKDLLQKYMEMIDYNVEFAYLRDYQPGDKLVIYAGRIEMCTAIAAYFKKRYPKLDVRRYADGDPYENLLDADIRVTTILSGGTAHDIPNLRVVIMTNAIQSAQANIQVLGRLRELKDRDVKFVYLYCEQVKRHVDYHHQRKDLFKERVAGIKDYRCPVLV